MTNERLLVEVEDLLRNAPALSTIADHSNENISWFGRFSAVIRAWDFRRSAEVIYCQSKMDGTFISNPADGFRRALTLLHEARQALRMETVGPASVAIAHGLVFDYFDELRRVIEVAKQDM